LVLLPLIRAQRDRVSKEQNYDDFGYRIRVGLAGGLGTPDALWAAFSMGADYVLTGSVNQACVEAGTSPVAKAMLQDAAFTDVSSGPAPDMFELGAKVQVLSRGSMYAQRAQRLYDIYKRYDSIEAIPKPERSKIEKQMFKRDLDEVWAGTKSYWAERDPAQVERAERDSHYLMALTFRWYLGMTSRWARMGEADRKRDFQVWCGPSMGGFNDWVAGTGLEPVEARGVVAVADALMTGAAVQARISFVRTLGVLA
jgi:PfaD family protein